MEMSFLNDSTWLGKSAGLRFDIVVWNLHSSQGRFSMHLFLSVVVSVVELPLVKRSRRVLSFNCSDSVHCRELQLRAHIESTTPSRERRVYFALEEEEGVDSFFSKAGKDIVGVILPRETT